MTTQYDKKQRISLEKAKLIRVKGLDKNTYYLSIANILYVQRITRGQKVHTETIKAYLVGGECIDLKASESTTRTLNSVGFYVSCRQKRGSDE